MSGQNNRHDRLDDGATALGISIGLLIGAVFALFNVKNRGDITRKNLTQFGAGTIAHDIDSSLESAKRTARQRRQYDDE